MAPKKEKNETKEKILSTYTLVLNDGQIEKLKAYCESRDDFKPTETPYALFSYKSLGHEKFNLTVYTSRKLLVTGKNTQDFVQNVLEPQITGTPQLGYDEVLHPDWFEFHAGLDESGKGDLFGPLSSCCVIAGKDAIKTWLDAGVRDSKTIADKTILSLEKLIRNTPNVIVKTVTTDMTKYNALYKERFKNLNKMLAHFHFLALREALAEAQEQGKILPEWGLLDQFSKTPLVQNELKRNDIHFDLRMRTHAESDPVVAAASIIARASYIKSIKKLEQLAGITLPKGCSSGTLKAGKALVEKFGNNRFGEFAKLHFKTAYEAQGLTPPPTSFSNYQR